MTTRLLMHQRAAILLRAVLAVVLVLAGLMLPMPSLSAAAGTSPISGKLVPLTSTRVADTRSGAGVPQGVGAVGVSTDVQLPVLGQGGVPSTGVVAVILTVTSVTQSGAGGLFVWASDDPRPTNPVVWFSATTGNVGNTVTLAPGADGALLMRTSAGSSDVAVDVVGYYTSEDSLDSGTFVPVVQNRIVDTRTGLGATQAKLAAGGSIDFQVAGQAGVPSSGVKAVVLNLTIANPSAATRLTAWPTGATRPATSQVQGAAGVNRSSQVVTKLSTAGRLSVYNISGTADVVVDVQGYYKAGAGAVFVPTDQSILFSSLAGQQTPIGATKLATGMTQRIQVTGAGNVPNDGDVVAVQAIVEVLNASGSGYLKIFPTPSKLASTPTSSAINFYAGQNIANSVTTGLSRSGTFDILWPGAAGSSTDLRVTVVGYFTGKTLPAAPDNLSASTNNKRIFLKWDRPASDGNDIISGYQVTVNPGNRVISVPNGERQLDIPNLTNNQDYTLTVTAINSVGMGPSSSQVIARPILGSAPIVYSDYFSENQTTAYSASSLAPATINWLQSSNGGSTYEYSLDSGAWIAVAAGNGGTSWYPTPGTHTFRMRDPIYAIGSTPAPIRTYTFTVGAVPAPSTPVDLFETDLDQVNPFVTALVPGVYDTGASVDFYLWDSAGNALGASPASSVIASVGNRVGLRLDSALLPGRQSFKWAARACNDTGCSTVTAQRAVTMPAVAPTVTDPSSTATAIIAMHTSVLPSATCDSACATADNSGVRIGTYNGNQYRTYATIPALSVPAGATVTEASIALSSGAGFDVATAGYVASINPNTWSPSDVAIDLADSNDRPADAIPDKLNLLPAVSRASALDFTVPQTVVFESRGSGLLSADASATVSVVYTTPNLSKPVRDLRAIAADGAAVLSWTPPVSVATSVYYEVTLTDPSGAIAFSKTTDEPFVLVQGLTNSVNYQASVRRTDNNTVGPAVSTSVIPQAGTFVGAARAAVSSFLTAYGKIDDGSAGSAGAALQGNPAGNAVSSALEAEAGTVASLQYHYSEEVGAVASAAVPDLSAVVVAQSGTQVIALARATSKKTYTGDGADSATSEGPDDLVFEFNVVSGSLSLQRRFDMTSWLVRGQTITPDGATTAPDTDPQIEAPAATPSFGTSDEPSDTDTVTGQTVLNTMRRGAAMWAKAHYNDHPFFIDDCTKFISDALWLGGNLRPVVKETDWLGNVLVKSKRNWMPAGYGVMGKGTYTWTVASYSADYFGANPGIWLNYWYKGFAGDIVYYDWQNLDGPPWIEDPPYHYDGRMDHASIVTYRSTRGELYVSQHSTPRINYPLRLQLLRNYQKYHTTGITYIRRITAIR